MLGRRLTHPSLAKPTAMTILTILIAVLHFFNRSSAAAVIVKTPVLNEGSTSG